MYLSSMSMYTNCRDVRLRGSRLETAKARMPDFGCGTRSARASEQTLIQVASLPVSATSVLVLLHSHGLHHVYAHSSTTTALFAFVNAFCGEQSGTAPSTLASRYASSPDIGCSAQLTWTHAATLGDITTPEDFLKAIGRSSESKLTPDSWEQLWHTDGFQLKKAGLSVQDRRCVPHTRLSLVVGTASGSDVFDVARCSCCVVRFQVSSMEHGEVPSRRRSVGVCA